MRKVLTLIACLFPVVAVAGNDPHEQFRGDRHSVIVKKGATLCPDHGEILAIAVGIHDMPGCFRIAKDAAVYQYGTPDQGIVAVGTPDTPIFYVLEAAVDPAPHESR
jgi:hypothetical protein